ncbi:MFS transporter [Sporolactobacillus sp. THM7-4]|nr:MFS transporter [Sporolactobacillus sp. THM7-4]
MRMFTLASCALYFLTGLTSISIGSVMPQLLNHYHVSYTIGGQLIFTGALGFLAGVVIASYLNSRFQPKPLLTLSSLIIACAQAGIFLLPPFPVFMGLYFMNSMGSATIGVVVATMIIEVFVGRQAVAMSYLEVSFGLGALTMPILASFFIALDIWRFLFIITTVLAVLLAFVWTKISYSKHNVNTSERLDAAGNSENRPPEAGKKWVMLGLFALIVFLYGGLEGSLNNFMSSIFSIYLGSVAYYASISIGVFWAAMVVGRAATGFIIRKVTYSRYLLTNIIGAIISLVLFIILRNVATGYFFVATLGLMMSGIYSITLVYANYSIPNSAHLVTPVIAGLSGLGSAVFPAFTGFAIDHAGMLWTLWYIVSIAFSYFIFLVVINQVKRGDSISWLHLFKRHHIRLAFATRRSRFK